MTVTEDERTALWRARLTGTDPMLKKLQARWRRVPSAPRCKLCAAPFRGLGGRITTLLRHGRARDNPLLCGTCFARLMKRPGGAEVPISVLFADVRGSTALAEARSPSEYRRGIQRFYEITGRCIEESGGIIDKLLGDGIMALFIPVFTGRQHADRALEAASRMVLDLEYSELPASGVRVGVGVHTGTAFVGVIGTDQHLDFSALGDTVNTAARLGSTAGAGHLVISRDAWAAGGRSVETAVAIDVAGRLASLEVLDLSRDDLRAI